MWQLLAVPVLVIASVSCLVWLFVSPSRTSLASALSISTVTLATLLWLAWFFRDGMGPDAVTTIGLKAWQHFWYGAAAPVAAWLAFAILAIARFWWWSRRRPNNSVKPNRLGGSA
jgi:hypothetical protein